MASRSVAADAATDLLKSLANGQDGKASGGDERQKEGRPSPTSKCDLRINQTRPHSRQIDVRTPVEF